MARFRKKPVEVEAFQWDGHAPLDPIAHWPKWFVDALDEDKAYFVNGPGAPRLVLRTLEGAMQASVGDWIIRGIKGELYACKPDVFAASYDEAA